jgi:hypothetical protein
MLKKMQQSEHTGTIRCCAECESKYMKEYRKKKKKELSSKAAEMYIKHADKIKEKSNTYYTENKERVLSRILAYSNTREGKLQSIKSNVKQYKRDNTMTDDDIMNMTDLPCFYCGIETVDAIKRNGIDRLDSSEGYHLSNCKPCCWECNRSKGKVDPITFIERNRHISFIAGGSGELTTSWSQVGRQTFIKYRNVILKSGKIFELTKNEFEELRAGKCNYCSRQTTDTHSNGIDRLNSDIGYVIENCVTCCRDCNMMKQTETVTDFLNRVFKIAERIFDLPVLPRVLTTFNKKLLREARLGVSATWCDEPR